MAKITITRDNGATLEFEGDVTAINVTPVMHDRRSDEEGETGETRIQVTLIEPAPEEA